MPRKAPHPNFIPKYTPEQKRLFFETLREMNGDVARAARKCGFPIPAVRYWIAKANLDDLPDEAKNIVQGMRRNVDSRLENMLFKIFAAAERNINKATLPQQLEAASKIVTMLRGMRNPPRETLPAPDQTKEELEALAMIARVQKRIDAQQSEAAEKPN